MKRLNIKMMLMCMSMVAFSIVKAQPGWTVSPTSYQNSMTITSMLNIEGEISSDVNDQVGLFYGNECRGVANVAMQEGKYYALLTAWSNASDNEDLSVKIYDASANKIYDLKQKVAFLKDESMGSYASPIIFYTNLTQKKLKTYNFITPNQDGKNDYFIVDDLTAVDGMTMKILNLKGVEVFKTQNYQNDWSGTYKDGKEVPTGTYYYLFIDQQDKTIYSGSVTIVR